MKKTELYRVGAILLTAAMVVTGMPQTGLYVRAEEGESEQIEVQREEPGTADEETVQQPSEQAAFAESQEDDAPAEVSPYDGDDDTESDPEPIVLEEIRLDKNTMTLDRAKNQTRGELSYNLFPEGVSADVTFTSSDPSIATVAVNGNIATVTATKPGTVEITARAKSGEIEKSAICIVDALVIPVTKVEINPKDLHMMKGATEKLTVKVSPDNADYPEVSLVVRDNDNNNIDTIETEFSNNVVTVSANSVGRASVTAVSQEYPNLRDTCFIEVSDVPSGSVALKGLSTKANYPKSMLQDEILEFSQYVIYNPGNTTDKALVWSVEGATAAGAGDEDVFDPNDYVEVDQSGRVTTKWKAGNTDAEKVVKIAAASKSDSTKKVTFTITIHRSNVPIKGLIADPQELFLEDAGENSEKTVRVQLQPLASTDREITATLSSGTAAKIASADEPLKTGKSATATADRNGWVSFVVTADKLPVNEKQNTGKITFTKKGQTADTVSAVKAVCDVTIDQYVTPVKDLRLSVSSLEIKDGDTAELTAVIEPLAAEDPHIVWTVDDTEIASVIKVVTKDEDGTKTETDIAADGKVKAEPITVDDEEILAATVKIKANMVGKCEITATAAGGVKKKCEVTVKDSDNPATGLTITSADDTSKEITEITLKKGQTYTLVPNVTVQDSTQTANKKVRWSSDSPVVASVSKQENGENGIVKANQEGSCEITAQASGSDDACKKKVKVNVVSPHLDVKWLGNRDKLTYKPADQPITEEKLRKELDVSFYPIEKPFPEDDKLTLGSDKEKNYKLRILREDGKTEKDYEPSDLAKPGTRTLVISYTYDGVTYKSTAAVEIEEFDDAKLISVTQLSWDNAEIWNVPNATPAGSLPLPKTTEITIGREIVEAGVTKTVTWNLDAPIDWHVEDSGYDPSITERQDFTVSGTVLCPAYVSNPDHVSLQVQTQVHVREQTVTGKKMPRPVFSVLGGDEVGDRTAVALPFGSRIELQSSIEGAEIYYMLDRRPDEERGMPHDEAYRYRSPIEITAKTTTIYAVAVKSGYYDSDCSECTIKLKYEVAVDPDDPNAGPLPDQVTPEDKTQIGGRVPDGLWAVVQKGASEKDGFAYTGTAIKPVVHVYDRTVLLTEKKDYTIAYSNNVNAGSAVGSAKPPTVTVTGKGNYEGKAVVHFTIRPQSIKEDAVLADQYLAVPYTGKALKPNPTLTWNGKKLVKNKDYTYTDVAYTEAGTYKFTVTGIGNYTGTKMIDFEIYQGGVSASQFTVSKIPNYQYTGNEIRPEVTVKYKKTLLFEGTEQNASGNYWIKYENCTNVGTASVVIVGKGNYKGAKRINFKILPKASIAKAGITLSDIPQGGVAYTGQPYTPKCIVNYLGEKLTEGKDYSLSYQNNVKAGTATVVITGMGAYNGTAKKTFKILQNNITGLTAVMDASYVYEKGGCKPKPKVTCNGMELVEGTDYTLTYKNNNKIGNTANVTVKGKGNYKGQIVRYFEITMQDIANLKVVAKDKVYQNKKNIYKTTVQVIDKNGKALTAGTDYSKDIYYTYESGEKRGMPVLASDIIPAGTVIGVDIRVANPRCYQGTIHGTYRIVQADIATAKVVIDPQEYTGRSVRLQKSQLQITVKGVPLGSNDYEIVGYENNVNQGNAKVTIKGVGSYGGTKTVTFKIKKKNILNLKY